MASPSWFTAPTDSPYSRGLRSRRVAPELEELDIELTADWGTLLT